MTKPLEIDIPSLSPEVIENLRDLEKRRVAGEKIDEDVVKGLRAIDLAGKIMNSITKGSQIDPVFIKNMILDLQKNLETQSKDPERKIIKKKKLKLKNKS